MPRRPKKAKKKIDTWPALSQVVDRRTVASSHTMAGRWSDTVVVRRRHDFSQTRTRQLLRQVSGQIFHYIKRKIETTEQEVEAMWVNDRILVAANDDDSTRALHAQLAQEGSQKAESRLGLLLTSELAQDERAKRQRGKIKQVLANQRLTDLRIAKVLREAVDVGASRCVLLDLSAGSLTELTDAAGRKKILFVVGSTLPHAEQKLCDALIQADIRTGAVVAGKKRPCLGCYLTMLYLRDVQGFGLEFGEHPGGYWKQPLQKFLTRIQSAGWDRRAALEWFAGAVEHYQSHKTSSGGKVRTDIDSDSGSDYSSDDAEP